MVNTSDFGSEGLGSNPDTPTKKTVFKLYTMGDKGHFWISIIKSGTRICACISALLLLLGPIEKIVCLSIGFGAAEFLGILEEVVDKRK